MGRRGEMGNIGETDEFSFLQFELCVMHPLHHALVIGMIAPPFIHYR
jgi:hypothetical protein